MQHPEISASVVGFVPVAWLKDHNVIIRITRFADQVFYQSLERFRVVETRNDHRNFSGFQQLSSDTKGVSAPVHGDMRGLAAAFQVSLNCVPRSFELSWFLANVAGAGILTAAPVV